MSRARLAAAGFTLLEVMIAMSILAISLMAITGTQGTSLRITNRTRFLTAASLLARSKMIDIEEQLKEEGFGDFDKELTGDFSDEGYPEVQWKAEIKKVEIAVPTGGGAAGATGSAGTTAGAGGMSDYALPSMYASIISDFIGNALREVTLSVWIGDEERPDDSLRVATHMIELTRAGPQEAPGQVDLADTARTQVKKSVTVE